MTHQPSIVKEAQALSELSRMTEPRLTAVAMAGQLGFHVDRVRRLLRLHEAPEIVKSACGEGVTIEISLGQEGGPQRTTSLRRTLDLLAALEFARIRQHLGRTLSEEEADRRTRELIEVALRNKWGLRRVQALRVEVEGGISARRRRARASGRAYRQNRSKLYIDASRVGQLAPKNRQALRAVLSKLIDELDRIDRPRGRDNGGTSIPV